MTHEKALQRLLKDLRSRLEMAEFSKHNDEAARLDRRIHNVERLLTACQRSRTIKLYRPEEEAAG